MISRISTAKRAAVGLALLALLAAGYVASIAGGDPAGPDAGARLGGASSACGPTVLGTLAQVGEHVYDDGVSGERTEIASRVVMGSRPLREAVERDDPVAARTVAQTLLVTGHMTSLTVSRGAQTLAAVGAETALAPLHGSIMSVGGAPIATFEASVWGEAPFISEMKGVTEAEVALRAGSENVGNSFALPPGELPPAGTLTAGDVSYEYDSFPASRYPAGALRIYVLKPVGALTQFCGPTPQDSVVNTLSRVASQIYAGEGGAQALLQVQRAQQNSALLEAVAAREPVAIRQAVVGLVYDHTHIVRLRVSAGGHVLADVGGPYVLAPVSAPLSLNGTQIGELVLSIQDDEGYLRLAKRLAGLNVLIYMSPPHRRSSPHHLSSNRPALVKNSLGPDPGAVPASGLFHYRGRSFRVFTLSARSFPSGALRISVLIPIPYS